MSDSILTAAPTNEAATTQPTTETKAEANTENNVEITPETAVKQEEKKELVADKFALAAKREAKIRAEREALKAEKEAIAKEKEALSQLKANKPANAIEALKQAGFTEQEAIDQLVEWTVNSGKIEQKKPTVNDELGSLKEQFEAFKQEKQQQQLAQVEAEQAAIRKQFENSIASHVTENAAKYPLIADSLIYNLVREVVEETAQNGKVLSLDEACEAVESYMAEQLESYYTETQKQIELANQLLAKKKGSKVDASESKDQKATVGDGSKDNSISSLSYNLTTQPKAQREPTPQEQEEALMSLIRQLK